MTVYAVHAQIITRKGDYEGSVSVPTFYLDSRVQGITSAGHAVSVAADVLNPLGAISSADLRVSAVPIDVKRESAELDMSAAEREHASMGPEHAAWCAGPGGHLPVPA